MKWLLDEDAALQKAHEKGQVEGKQEIAINMLKASKPLDEISFFTGLSQDEIMKFRNKL